MKTGTFSCDTIVPWVGTYLKSAHGLVLHKLFNYRRYTFLEPSMASEESAGVLSGSDTCCKSFYLGE